MKTIMIRAHHMLCMQGFQGYGYDQAFIDNFEKILEMIKEDPYTEITLVDESDIFCACCPNNYQGICKRSEDADSNIKSIDKNVLKKIGKISGNHDSYKNLLNKINETFKTIDDVKDVCGDCDWKENCLWHCSLDQL